MNKYLMQIILVVSLAFSTITKANDLSEATFNTFVSKTGEISLPRGSGNNGRI